MAKGSRGLSGLSIQDLHREIRARQRRVVKLQRTRARLERRLDAVDAEIALSGGGGGRRGGTGMGARTRARNKLNLVGALGEVLKGKTMSVTDVADAVRRAGYHTTSPNFRTMVNAALLKKKYFKRISRGQYTAA